MSSILSSIYNEETLNANKLFNDARNATSTNVIPRTGFNQKILNNNNTGMAQDSINCESNQSDFFMSPLSGQQVTKEAFHDNMVPFIKNKNQHNINIDAYSNTLGRHTGNDETYRQKKQEVKPFFEVSSNNSFVNGSPSFTESVGLDRYIPSQKRQSEKVFQSIHVGPGIGGGYTSLPSGGFNQNNSREYILPKTIDETRTLTKQKQTYESRIVAGLKSAQRGLQAKPVKHRPERYHNSNPERGNMSSAIKASKLREKFYMKPTQKETQKEYFGVLGNSQIVKPRKEGAIQKSTKNNYTNPAPRNAYREHTWSFNEQNEKDGFGDYGKNSIENKPNERDTTQSRMHLNNISIVVKKLITPITDFFRRTRKENFIGNIRPDGNMNASMPSKQTIYDPNDIARTTIKEQTEDNEYQGSLKGSNKHIIHDPNDITRTTIKEQTEDNDYQGSLRGINKQTIYDPNDLAKTTIKEQFVDNKYTGQFSGEKHGKAYDPDDIARTTIKEQNIHNKAPYLNMNPQHPRSARVYDPEDITKTTMKEVTIDNEHIGFVGNQHAFKTGGYISTSVDMKNTNRQFLTDWYYQGVADCEVGTGGGRGYLAAQYEAKNTNRQFLNDHEWEGPAKSYYNNPTSYSSMYNAHLNPNKEEISTGREPTFESVKLNVGGDFVNIEHRRIDGDKLNMREPTETVVYGAAPQKNNCGMTRTKSKLPEDTQRSRMNPEILNAFRDNPYTQSLSSSSY